MNDDKTSKDSAFEKVALEPGIRIKRTRPYSPWQNKKVERSHREDGKMLYERKIFTMYGHFEKFFITNETYVLITKRCDFILH